jgi:hypothetical protein
VLYTYSCITPQDPLGKLVRSDGNPPIRTSSATNVQTSTSPSPARGNTPTNSSRPLTTDSVARRFIAGHLGIKMPTTPERREYESLVRAQAQRQKEEQQRQLQKEKENQERIERERRDVWERG